MATAQDVARVLTKFLGSNYSSPWTGAYYEFDEKTDVGAYRIQTVATGGGENKGSNAFIVFRVEEAFGAPQFFRKDGYYASYVGFEWDGDFYEVKPQEKTVTVYEEAVEGNKLDAYDDSYSYDDEESSY